MANRTTHQVVALITIVYVMFSLSCVTRNKPMDSVNKIAIDSARYWRMQDSLVLGVDCLHTMDSFFVQYDGMHDYYPHNLDSFMCNAFNCLEKRNIYYYIRNLELDSIGASDALKHNRINIFWNFGKERNWYFLLFNSDGYPEKIRLFQYFGPGIQAMSDNYKPIVDVQKPPRSQEELREIIHQNNLKVVTERKSKYPCIEIDYYTILNDI